MNTKQITATLLMAVFLISTMAVIAPMPTVNAQETNVSFSTLNSATAEWSTDQAHSGSYSVKFHAEVWGKDAYALSIPVDVPLNGITELSYWRNGMVYDYAPPTVLLCIDANGDGRLDFSTQDVIDVLMSWEKSGLLGDDAILGVEGDWVDTGWTQVDVLAKDWRWGGAWWFDKNGWSGWLSCSSLEEFIEAGGLGPSDAGFPCPIHPTDHVMLVVIAGGNPDGDLYVDAITVNGVTYDEPTPPTPPDVSEVGVIPETGITGTTFTIKARVYDTSGVKLVTAHLFLEDNEITGFELFDDGEHNDNEAGDGIYANAWDSTGASTGTYSVMIFAMDMLDNAMENYDLATFTVEAPPTPPPVIPTWPSEPYIEPVNITEVRGNADTILSLGEAVPAGDDPTLMELDYNHDGFVDIADAFDQLRNAGLLRTPSFTFDPDAASNTLMALQSVYGANLESFPSVEGRVWLLYMLGYLPYQ